MSSSGDWSIVEYFAEHEGYRCGYCKSPNTNYSHGMWAHSLTVEDYQDLIDRGWRRSGKYCYKPTMNLTCCPMYTIRCSAVDFQLSKSQKKVLKRVHHYLSHGSGKQNSVSNSNDADVGVGAVDGPVLPRNKPKKNLDVSQVRVMNSELNITQGDPSEYDTSAMEGAACVNTAQVPMMKPKKTSSAQYPGEGADAVRPPCKKAKLLRKQRRMEKMAAKGLATDTQAAQKQSIPQKKSLEDFLQEPLPADPAHRLEVRLVRSHPASQEFQSSFQEGYQVYAKYQQAVHQDPPEKCSQKQYTRFLVQSPLQLVMVRSNPMSDAFHETFDASHQVFRKYQMQIHKESEEECGKEEFTQFLVNSPLQECHQAGGPEMGFGSFHQQYWLDGHLIAVGVLDVLPRCVSSVYFFYDPEVGFLSPGTYGSLREIGLVRSLAQRIPLLAEYYMGFYIHSCPKMRYKGQLSPSFLLCPEAYSWRSIQECRPLLDAAPYRRLETDPQAKDPDISSDLHDVLVLYKNVAMPYEMYCHKAAILNNRGDEDEEVKQYAQLVGQTCASRMLLYRS